MSSSLLTSCIGQQRVFLPGHFDVSVVLGGRTTAPTFSAGHGAGRRF